MWWKIFSAVLAAGLVVLGTVLAVNSSMNGNAVRWDDEAGFKIHGLNSISELLSLGADSVETRDKRIQETRDRIADAKQWLKEAPSRATRRVELSKAIEGAERATIYVPLR